MTRMAISPRLATSTLENMRAGILEGRGLVQRQRRECPVLPPEGGRAAPHPLGAGNRGAQRCDHALDGVLDALVAAVDHQVCRRRRLVGIVDAGEAGDLAGAGPRVEAL